MNEVERLKILIEEEIHDSASVERIFASAYEIANEAESRDLATGPTGLALGFVQSGKTTAMTALAAECADRGYEVIIALLGITNLLLGQNTDRLIEKLGIEDRDDYKWVSMRNPKGKTAAIEMEDWMNKGRTIFVPVLKHAGRIKDLTDVLAQVNSIGRIRCLIMDDEADQASLNTLVRTGDESKVYGAIDSLRNTLQNHAFIQFTATPYAPLLLEFSDPLFPEFVNFLEPGKGYTGGREFFLDHSESVVRYIPATDEQSTRLPIELPRSLINAIWSFIIGSAILDHSISGSRPISMLIHPSSRKDVQDRYMFLLTRTLAEMNDKAIVAFKFEDLGKDATSEYDRLIQDGCTLIPKDELLLKIRFVMSEVKTWLLHSASAVKKVNWNLSPFHILIGGNKLDRGFTVEGLTVTYMNRPSSDQVDTVEQRARAFGYRAEFLPYCKFFSTARTIKMLREIVVTEYDLRSRLIDAVDRGESIADWARDVGLLIPEGSKPTRDNVVKGLSSSSTGWRQWRRPNRSRDVIGENWKLMENLGLMEAPLVDYQRLSFRTLEVSASKTIDCLREWRFDPGVSTWEFDQWIRIIERQAPHQESIFFILMEQFAGTEEARPRVRRALPEEGFINLFQGRDVNPQKDGIQYPGDREIWPIVNDPSQILVQIHRVTPREEHYLEMLTPAIYLGDRGIVRKV